MKNNKKDSLGHFCYGCNKYFHDPNPKIIEHKNCEGNKSLGVCVDSKEFGEYHYYNLKYLSKSELIDIIHKLDNTEYAHQNNII